MMKAFRRCQVAVSLTLTVNGEQHTVSTDPDRPLLEVLREDLRLTGTKYGCGEGQCRACTVLLTEEGQRQFRAMAREHEDWVVQIFSGLGPAQQAQLFELLGQLKLTLPATQTAPAPLPAPVPAGRGR